LLLKREVLEKLKLNDSANEEIKILFGKVVHHFNDTHSKKIPWLNDEWIDNLLRAAPNTFNSKLDRWRKLYKAADKQVIEAHEILNSGRFTSKSKESKEAKRNYYQGLRQKEILNNKNEGELSEFYPYRYLASEGFLPGYNFTRLPIRTFIPVGDSGEYVSRPRFIALREFGPWNIIYYSGKKYRISQLLLPEAEQKLKKAKICKSSGYFLEGDDYNFDRCPFSDVPITDGTSKETYVDLLEMSETRTQEQDRISCEEEERLSKG
ncbi:unnamed protein product, partial [marine sediment metagenome]